MIFYHLTSKINFKLDPKFHPTNNTTLGGDWPHPGIFLGKSVEAWVNGYGYWRPWVVEFETAGIDSNWGGYSGEVFVPATDYAKLRLVRIVPLDAHCREEFGEWGWTEEATRTTFDTFESIPPEKLNSYGLWRGYRYPGDARNAPSDWRQKYVQRVAKHQRSHGGAYASVRGAWAARIAEASL